ncbi:acetyl-CoA synthetase-like protein [Vararia minispora EC-137]|uniref:Acetyl-CoA synthetase-like protein n=1 Tax=Vararia minispora EC-137 TaxID=1314806 RepID=A0ACB8QMN9_9AGAM|nr:acetyl-CoA synthetase-like protein [Vararia minispora EC-137]
MVLVGFPRTHGHGSATFAPPALDSSIALPEIFDWHFEHSPRHPFARYEDELEQIRTIYWSEVARSMHRAASWIAGRVSQDERDAALNGQPIVISILSSCDPLTYIAMEMGIMRAGFTVFMISTRNSPEAIAHLLFMTRTKLLLVDATITPPQEAVAKAMAFIGDASEKPSIYTMPKFEELYPPDAGNVSFERYLRVAFESNAPALIMHSSGSTSFPKPILYTHDTLLKLSWPPRNAIHFGEIDLCGKVISCHGLPMFHGMGLMHILFAATTGIELAVFKPSSHAITPNPQNVLESMKATSAKIVMAVPSVLEAWSRMPTALEYLRTMECVLFGGGPLVKEIGDFLVREGVPLHNEYGLTECGLVTTFIPANAPGTDWQYINVSPNCLPEFIPQGDGTFELVFVDHETHKIAVTNAEVNGRPAYATSDLVVPHPTNPRLWKIQGRKDDQIMLSTGEKTNPGPLEDILTRDPHVRAAVMFGRERFQNGVIIEPVPDFAFDPSDERKLEAFRNAIWCVYARMILVASPSKPFAYTLKMTPRKKAIVRDYEHEINALYDAVAETSQIEVDVPESWDRETALRFVREIVSKTMKEAVGDDENLFAHGLQAVWIRNSILRVLRRVSPPAAKALSPTFVYDNPTVRIAAAYLSALVQSPSESFQGPDLDARARELEGMLETYLDGLPERVHPRETIEAADEEVFFVTGTTGCLGANILAELLASPDVRKVYAFNRPAADASTTSLDRHRSIFAMRGLDVALLDGSKATLLEGDLSLPFFGLDERVYGDLHASVTHIIHNAWRINMNLPLASFEPLVRGTQNLAAFVLSSPRASAPHTLFISSIGVLSDSPCGGPLPEQALPSARTAASSGYSASKWLGERIVDLGLPHAAVVRLGQIAGDAAGNWTETEWFPALVRAGERVGCLPRIDGDISWITAPDCARALTALARADTAAHGWTFHVVNPRPTPFGAVLEPAADALTLPLVAYEEWLRRLEQLADADACSVQADGAANGLSGTVNGSNGPAKESSGSAHASNGTAAASNGAVITTAEADAIPALRLLPLYRAHLTRRGRGWEPPGVPTLDCAHALRAAPVLGAAHVIGAAETRAWIARWHACGFLRAGEEA